MPGIRSRQMSAGYCICAVRVPPASEGMLGVGRPGGWVSPMHTPASVGLRATSQAWDLPMRGCAGAHSSVRLCGRVGTPAAVFTGRGGGKPSDPWLSNQECG